MRTTIIVLISDQSAMLPIDSAFFECIADKSDIMHRIYRQIGENDIKI